MGVPWTQRGRVAAWRRHRAVDVVARMIDGFRLHRTGKNGALIAHFAFISVFPLLIVFTTVIGFVLEGRPDLQRKIIDSTLTQIPTIGPQLKADPTRLRGDVLVLVLGLVSGLWAGMKAFVALQGGLDDVDEVPLDARMSFVKSRVHALAGIVVIGGAQVLTTASSSVAGYAKFAIISRVLIIVGSVAVNSLIVMFSFRWLRTRRPPWRATLPGAIVAGVLYAGLQLVGTAVVARAIAKASPVYGTFALVIGLLTWMSLHAFVALGAAELNVALHAAHTEAGTTTVPSDASDLDDSPASTS